MGQGVDRQEAAGQVIGQFCNRTEPFFRSKPGPLMGDSDLLLTLVVMYDGSSTKLKYCHSLGDTMMLNALQWMRWWTGGTSLLKYRTIALQTIHIVSGLDKPHQYWLSMKALGSPTPTMISMWSNSVLVNHYFYLSLYCESFKTEFCLFNYPQICQNERWVLPVFWFLHIKRLTPFELVSSASLPG